MSQYQMCVPTVETVYRMISSYYPTELQSALIGIEYDVHDRKTGKMAATTFRD